MRFASLTKLALLIAVIAPVAARATTISVGNSPAAVPGDIADGCDTCLFIPFQTFSAAGYTVTDYSFYALQAGTITPVLFSGVTVGNNTTFTVTGIGQTQAVAAGLNSNFAFNLQPGGSALTGTSTYFGFTDDSSKVEFAYTLLTTGTYLASPQAGFGVGTTFGGPTDTQQNPGTIDALNGRAYQIEAFAVSPSIVPEPSSLLLFGTGILGVAGFARRKFLNA